MLNSGPILPGSCIGILGAGQLGKMTAMAAARLGYRTVVWTPPGDVPAAHVATHSIIKPYEDPEAMKEFVKRAAVATIEFENIPVEILSAIGEHIPVRPSPRVLKITQDRWLEKMLFGKLCIPAAPTWVIVNENDTKPSLQNDSMFPAILKTRHLGYDGKGQIAVKSAYELASAWKGIGMLPCVLEKRIEFKCEGSVIVARSPYGAVRVYPVLQNMHKDGILRQTKWPMRIVPMPVQKRAEQMAIDIADELKLEGLLAVEMFFTENNTIFANELAPRPHNSGHGTIEACAVSQFEQHVRAVCGLPLGMTEPHSSWHMENLIGDEIDAWREVLTVPNTTLHVYGKAEARPGRKMGHKTTLSALPR